MGAEYYFFTDTDLLIQQSAALAFGPVNPASVASTDEYRVTSLHSASNNPTAYAACDATVCVQKVTANPTLVNVILKPLVQPALNFAPVKYIIYKGILANSLIDPNGTDVAPSATNQLTAFAWDVQTKKNASANTPNVTAPAAALGIGLTGTGFADTDPIDNLFYRAGVTFQLLNVDGGWSIGQFDKSQFGIEVLMEGLNFQHSLTLARQIENKISVTSLTGSETDAQKFDHWHAKEQILGFMDPCAFYGSFFLAGIQATTSAPNSGFVATAGNDLYHNVLLPLANRNTAYLDIRNEHNFSLNYFKNYETIAGTSTTTNVMIGATAVDYYASDWPLLALTAVDFAAGNTIVARNTFALQLPVGDNPAPLVYVSQGYRDINSKGDDFPAELTSAEQFFADFDAPVDGYTVAESASGPSSLTFAVANATGQGATTPVSCYIRLKYLKQQQGATTVPTVIQAANYLDNLIWPLDLKILLASPGPIKTAVYEEDVYVNAQDVAGLGFDCIARVGIARDANNTSFFLIPVNIRTQAGQASASITLSGEASDSSGDYPNLIVSKYVPERVRQSELIFSSTNQVPLAQFVSDGDSSENAQFVIPDFTQLFIITVANGAFDTWINKAAALATGFRTYLGIKNMQTAADGIGVAYTSFDLVLRGFVSDATAGTYNIEDIGTDPASATANITVYTDAGD